MWKGAKQADMAGTDYYQILEVSRGASADDIRRAYKKLSRQFHPDRNPDDASAASRFKEVQEAYSVLSDNETRQQYDRFGSNFRQAAGAAPFPGYAGGEMPAGFDFSNLFGGQVDLESLLAGSRSPRRPPVQRGHDITMTIQVPFQVAATGGSHDLDVRRDGRSERLSVKIPVGISDGEVLRLRGQGSPGQGGPPGDLLVTVQVAPHPWFRREGNNLLLDVPLTVAEAALGARVDVPTLIDGTVILSIPPGTSSGARLRMKEKGIGNPQSGRRGDQFVVIRIVVPEETGENMRAIFEQLAESDPTRPRDELW